VLELVTWCLRGSPRANQQGVVRSWLSRLDCDVTVARRPLGFRLALRRGQLVEGRVLSAADEESLAVAGPVVELVRATDPEVSPRWWRG
jgi:hypothetical protein